MFYYPIQNFRAIAILIIVLGHSFGVSGVSINSYSEIFVRNLFSGGTTLFVFVSGMIFTLIFSKQMIFTSYIKRRSLRLLLPYLILSIIPMALHIYTKNPISNGFFLPPEQASFVQQYIIPVIKYLVTGRFMTAYWYIPFAMLLFCMAPVVMKFLELKIRSQCFLLVIALCIASFSHRPIDNINHLHSLMFFFPVYLLGAFVAQRRAVVLPVLNRHLPLLILMVAVICSIQSFYGHVGSYHKNLFEYQGLDLMLIQKLFLSLVLLTLFDSGLLGDSKITKILADMSFSIFFIHPYLIFIFRNISKKFDFVLNYGGWISYVLLSIFFVTFSCLLAFLFKILLKNNSKYLIGY